MSESPSKTFEPNIRTNDGLARAHNWPVVAIGPSFIMRPLLILVFMGGAILAGFEADARTAMGAAIAATYISSLTQFLMLRVRLSKVLEKGKRAYRPKDWFLVAMPVFLIEGFYSLLTTVDILFVSKYMQPEDAGIYFAAIRILALVHFVYYAVKAASAHRFSAYRNAGDHETYSTFVRQTLHWTFWPSLALSLIMALIGKYLLMLFGSGFVGGTPVIWILSFGLIIRASVGPAETLLAMSGQQNATAIAYGFTLFVAIALNIALIPDYGLVGAASATAIAMAFESAALYIIARKRLGLHVFIIPHRKTSAPVKPQKNPAE